MYKDNINNDHNYNTPLYLFNYLNKHFKFELDPCDSGNKWLGLPYNFTKEDNGLLKKWDKNAFVNPPYGGENESNWLRACLQESNENNTSNFILLPSKTESKWFGYYLLRASVVIFIQKRISFIKDGKPMNGNTMGSLMFGFMNTLDDDLRITKFGDIAYEFYDDSIRNGIRGYEESHDNGIYFLFPDRDLLKEKYS